MGQWENLKYTKTHEWIRVQSDGTLIIGISDHAQKTLGDLVFVELPEPGDKVGMGDDCVVVESVKAASDVYSPAAGVICEVNSELEDQPQLVNEQPYNNGWLYKLKPDDQISNISQDWLSYAEYVKILQAESEEVL